MSLAEVDSAIAICQRHLDKVAEPGTEVGAFLTVYLLILICGAFENELERLVVERAKRAMDDDLTSFVQNSMKEYHGLKVSDLKGKLLKKFGVKHTSSFEGFLQREWEAVQKYQNIVTNRHSIAHGTPIYMTFEELIGSYSESKKVLKEIQTILGVQ